MTGRRVVALLLAAVASTVLGAGRADGQVPEPSIALSVDAAASGQAVAVTGTAWPPTTALTLMVCGGGVGAGTGTEACDVLGGETVVTDPTGGFSTTLVVRVPPAPCPCTVWTSSAATGTQVSTPLAIVGAPLAPPSEAPATDASTTEPAKTDASGDAAGDETSSEPSTSSSNGLDWALVLGVVLGVAVLAAAALLLRRRRQDRRDRLDSRDQLDHLEQFVQPVQLKPSVPPVETLQHEPLVALAQLLQPVRPTQPVRPVPPVQPVQPVQLVPPAQPVECEEPVQPVQPDPPVQAEPPVPAESRGQRDRRDRRGQRDRRDRRDRRARPDAIPSTDPVAEPVPEPIPPRPEIAPEILALLETVLNNGDSPSGTDGTEQPPADDGRLPVTFTLPDALAAKSVVLCGDFNGWSRTSTPLHRDGDTWTVAVPLEAGRTYRYQFLVDGRVWTTGTDGRLANPDPFEPWFATITVGSAAPESAT
jgi:hypothetical protein